jgi:HPr kinase/phosphorylase
MKEGEPQERGVTSGVQVAELLGPELKTLEFTVVVGEEHLGRWITHPRVQKPGLALAGYLPYVKEGRVQILGSSELGFAQSLSPEVRRERFSQICQLKVPVFLVTKGLRPPEELLESAAQAGIAVLVSRALSSVVIKRVGFFLEDRLVPSTQIHGVLVDVYGLGVLLIGASGVGKSEAALDLITRGHSFVCDDRVTIKRYPNGDLVGFADPRLQHHMELRGLGIINIQDLFGLAAVRERKTIDLVVELEPWQPGRSYDRLGLDETVYEILGIPCCYLRLPVSLGRNIANLVEIAARNHVLKLQGVHSAQRFTQKIDEQLVRRGSPADEASRPESGGV